MKINNNYLSAKEIVLSILLVILIFSIYFLVTLSPRNFMEASFLNIGQGDALLLQTPNNFKILIDGGPDKNILEKLGHKLSYFDNNIDMIIVTHDDMDHAGGLVHVLKKYKVRMILTSMSESEAPVMKEIIKIAKTKNIEIIKIDSPKILQTSDGVIIKVLFPISNMDKIEDGNNASIVTQIIFNESKILTTGDLGISGEIFLTEIYKDSLESDILKLGHHGSDTSTSPIFLQIVKPKVAIISAGKNNTFNHPHKRVTDLLNNFNISFLETSKVGDITFRTDGTNIWRN